MMNLLTKALRSTVLALLLSLLLLSFSGLAHAASPAPLAAPLCLTATPATQTVVGFGAARVQITVNCLPQTQHSSVDVAWGDQTTSQFTLCAEICPNPPVVISAAHSYKAVGDFHPNICEVPSPSGSGSLCVQVEVRVELP